MNFISLKVNHLHGFVATVPEANRRFSTNPMKTISLGASIIAMLASSLAAEVIDVVIAYDNSHQKMWGDAEILEEARQVLNFTEAVFSNSGLEVEFNIVHIFHDATFTECGKAFMHFYTPRYKYTKAFGADLFIFFANNGGWHELGQATLPGSYCFVNLYFFGASNGGWIVAHEIGHTFGGGHESASECGIDPSARAYVWDGDDEPFWTILTSGTYENLHRIPFFSDPRKTYGNKVLGVPARSRWGQVNMDAADNFSTINQRIRTAAERESSQDYLWRHSVTLPNGFHWSEWFGYFNLNAWHKLLFTPSGSGRYIYHEYLGWCWVPSNATVESLWLWSHRLQAWVFAHPALGRHIFVQDGSTGWLAW